MSESRGQECPRHRDVWEKRTPEGVPLQRLNRFPCLTKAARDGAPGGGLLTLVNSKSPPKQSLDGAPAPGAKAPQISPFPSVRLKPRPFKTESAAGAG